MINGQVISLRRPRSSVSILRPYVRITDMLAARSCRSSIRSVELKCFRGRSETVDPESTKISRLDFWSRMNNRFSLLGALDERTSPSTWVGDVIDRLKKSRTGMAGGSSSLRCPTLRGSSTSSSLMTAVAGADVFAVGGEVGESGTWTVNGLGIGRLRGWPAALLVP